MKVVIGLVSPAMEIIGDVSTLSNFDSKIRNPCIFTWSGEYMKVIPFRACKDGDMNIPSTNIAWTYEANEKASKYHNKIVAEEKKNPSVLMTEDEHDKILADRQKDVEKTLKKTKNK